MNLRLIAIGAGAVLALTACGTGTSSRSGTDPSAPPTSTPPSATAAPSPDLTSFYGQKLTWKDCNASFQCATLKVPLDYKNPTAKSIDISVIKDPATVKSQGSLVINPGGPGGSGIDYALNNNQAFDKTVRDHYDIVGFDPRGVGQSTAVSCLSDHDLDGYVAVDPTPDDAAEQKTYVGWARKMATGCDTKDPGLAAHVSTVEAARDMDVLRAALGQSKLDYFGASYGTKLGSTYAALYPSKVGHFVLDGAMAPNLTAFDVDLAQAQGFEVALKAYLQHCVDRGGCFLGGSVGAGIKRIDGLLDEIDAEPLPAGKRELTSGNALYGLLIPLYSRSTWSYLDQALKAALKGDGSQLLYLSDSYASRRENGTYENTMEANWAINCLDDSTDYSPSKVLQEEPRFKKVSPTFGPALAWMLAGCTGDKFKASEPAPDPAAKGASPILVIGTTRDPATPYSWAKELATTLDSGVLISRDGDGHTGYKAGNTCVDNAVDGYLVGDKVPKDGLNC